MRSTSFKVIPGLSIRSSELRKRLSNNSLTLPEFKGSFSLDEGIDATLRMTRAEVFRSHLEGLGKIRVLQAKAAKEKADARNKASIKALADIKAKAIADFKASGEKGGSNG